MKRFACATALFVCVVLAAHGDQVSRGLTAGIALQPPTPFSRLHGSLTYERTILKTGSVLTRGTYAFSRLTESRRAHQFSAVLGLSAHRRGNPYLGARSTLLGPYFGSALAFYYYVIPESGYDGPVFGTRFDSMILIGWNIPLGERTFVRVEISPLFYRSWTENELTGELETRNRLGFAARLEPGIFSSR